jgi:ubiquinone/menaquinone biosynthesis C-methylase UbiE
MDRQEWLRTLRRENEDQENALAPEYDERWGQIGETHRAFIERFLSKLPPGGRVLDAACGTGKYFGLVLDSGRALHGTDHTMGYLARAESKFPQATTARFDLQDLPFENEFDGVMCVDAMEFVPPEDWPAVLARIRRALHADGWLYLTVELNPEDEVLATTEHLRGEGLPVVDGEVLWGEGGGRYYHYYPSMDQVRAWISGADLQIEDELEGALGRGLRLPPRACPDHRLSVYH